jgi:tetratricopeptide (TPR) repeat protein
MLSGSSGKKRLSMRYRISIRRELCIDSFFGALARGVVLASVFLFFYAAAVCRAETIKLKSGTVVRGRIVGETSQIVQVQVYGVQVPYFRNEILSIQKDDEEQPARQEELPAAGKILPVVKEKSPAEGDKKPAAQKNPLDDIKGPYELKIAVRSARRHLKNKEFKAAVLDLETVRLKYPDNPDLNAVLGSVCLAEKRYDQGVQCFEKAVVGAGAESPYWRGLGKAYFGAGRTDDAEKVLQKVVASGQTKKADTYLFLGRISLKKKQYEQALGYLKEGAEIEKAPSAEILHYMGWAQYCLNNYKEAIVLWEKAMEKGYPFTGAWGRAYLKIGNYKKAAEYLEKSLGSPNADKSEIYERLGQVYLSGNDKTKAAEYFRKASELGNMEAEDALKAMQRQ